MTTESTDRYRPHVLREYAVLGDGERGAVVGADGQVVWMCAPRWHSDPVFDRLLGGRCGYQVSPTDGRSVWSGAYQPGGLIWCAQWVTGTTVIHCTDALAVPADPSRIVLLRRITAGDQPIRVMVRLDLPKDAARQLTRVGLAWVTEWQGQYVRWHGASDATITGDGTGLRLVRILAAGSRHDLVLEVSDRPCHAAVPDPESLWRQTEQTWADWTPDAVDTLVPHDVRHAYAVLRGLTSSSGGMVAAATTALPERERAGANYDYRYAWIRDQCWVGQGVAAHGDHPLLHAATHFVTQAFVHGLLIETATRLTGEPERPHQRPP